MEKSALLGERTFTIQAVKVNGKKMPLQPFKQIPRAECLVPNNSLDQTLNSWGGFFTKFQTKARSSFWQSANGSLSGAE